MNNMLIKTIRNNKIIFYILFIMASSFAIKSKAQIIYSATKADTLYWEERFEEAANVQAAIIKANTAVNAKMFPNDLMFGLVIFCATIDKIDTTFQLLNDLVRRKKFDFYGLYEEVPLKKLQSDKRWKTIDSIVKNRAIKEFGLEKYSYIVELYKIEAKDQAYRHQMGHYLRKNRREKAEAYSTLQVKLDQANYATLDSLLKLYGWPIISKYGARASDIAFLVIQHADLPAQKKYLPLIEEYAKKGDVDWSNYCLLFDRIRVDEHQKQLYGTQLTFDKELGKYVLLPVEDPDNLNKRRFEKGLGSIESYLQSF
jgi:hypothetical protein